MFMIIARKLFTHCWNLSDSITGNVPLRSEVKRQGSGYWITIDTDCTGKESCPTWQDIWEYKTDEHVSQGKNGKETISYNCLWTFALSQVMLHLT